MMRIAYVNTPRDPEVALTPSIGRSPAATVRENRKCADLAARGRWGTRAAGRGRGTCRKSHPSPRRQRRHRRPRPTIVNGASGLDRRAIRRPAAGASSTAAELRPRIPPTNPASELRTDHRIRPPVTFDRPQLWIVAGIVAWGVFHAVGAYRFNHDPRRAAVVFGCVVAFVAFWWGMSAARRRRLSREAEDE